jgi:hypothetical protein
MRGGPSQQPGCRMTLRTRCLSGLSRLLLRPVLGFRRAITGSNTASSSSQPSARAVSMNRSNRRRWLRTRCAVRTRFALTPRGLGFPGAIVAKLPQARHEQISRCKKFAIRAGAYLIFLPRPKLNPRPDNEYSLEETTCRRDEVIRRSALAAGFARPAAEKNYREVTGGC